MFDNLEARKKMADSQYNYQHDEVKKYFELLRAKGSSHILSIKYDDLSLDILEEWLNNYTTLLNVWFCELVYNPTCTNNKQWESNLLIKLKNESRMTIPEIIDFFNIKTIVQLSNNKLLGVEEFEQHLYQYMATRKYFKGDDLLKETLAESRTNLTLKLFCSLIRDHEKKLNIHLKPIFPVNPAKIAEGNFGYHNLVAMEKAREEDIKEMIVHFDWYIARPILVEKGYVK